MLDKLGSVHNFVINFFPLCPTLTAAGQYLLAHKVKSMLSVMESSHTMCV